MTTTTKTNDRVGEALGQLLDMFESGNFPETIAGYAQKEKPLNAIMRVLSRVQAALELILSHAPEARETATSQG